jgi:hypothetical protein
MDPAAAGLLQGRSRRISRRFGGFAARTCGIRAAVRGRRPASGRSPSPGMGGGYPASRRGEKTAPVARDRSHSVPSGSTIVDTVK